MKFAELDILNSGARRLTAVVTLVILRHLRYPDNKVIGDIVGELIFRVNKTLDLAPHPDTLQHMVWNDTYKTKRKQYSADVIP